MTYSTSFAYERRVSKQFFECVPRMSCEPLLNALKDCLLRSDCVIRDKILPSICLREHTNELPQECQSLRRAVFDCKRSQVCFFIELSWCRINVFLTAGYAKKVPWKACSWTSQLRFKLPTSICKYIVMVER